MIEYLQNEDVKALIDNAPSYQKSALTGLRKVKFTTYVKNNDSVRVESEPYLPGVVIARNPGVIGQVDGKDVYNEWPISIEVAEKNYGKDVINSLTDEITFHKKQATIKAIELTSDIMEKLGVKGDVLNIKVSWSPEPMVAHVGDFITNAGYSVSSHDMKNTYEPVAPVAGLKSKIQEMRTTEGTSNKLKP